MFYLRQKEEFVYVVEVFSFPTIFVCSGQKTLAGWCKHPSTVLKWQKDGQCWVFQTIALSCCTLGSAGTHCAEAEQRKCLCLFSEVRGPGETHDSNYLSLRCINLKQWPYKEKDAVWWSILVCSRKKGMFVECNVIKSQCKYGRCYIAAHGSECVAFLSYPTH